MRLPNFDSSTIREIDNWGLKVLVKTTVAFLNGHFLLTGFYGTKTQWIVKSLVNGWELQIWGQRRNPNVGNIYNGGTKI